MSKEPGKKELQKIDAWLARAGFKRAKRPKGAMQRARAPKAETPKAVVSRRGDAVSIIRPGRWHWDWLRAGFSTRTGGSSTCFGGHDLNLGLVKHDPRQNVERNRKRFLAEIGARSTQLVMVKQIHSGIIHVVNELPTSRLVGDGMITNVPDVTLAVLTADCVPVLLVDPRRRAVGAFHAGWRGTAKRIVEKGVGMMRMAYGSDPRDVYAAIGPCIGQCCYAVGDEVLEEFLSQFSYAAALVRDVYDEDPIKRKYPLLFLTARAPGHSDLGPQKHLDLVEANRRQLLDAGVRAEHIWASGLCTSCSTERLFSHRKEGGFTGRMMGVIGMERSS
jgi:YfiH family protein